jgi:hypothetical protein
MRKKFEIINLSKISSTPSINILPYVMLTLSFVNKNSPTSDGVTFKPGIKIFLSFGWLIWDFQITNL